jgi:phosphoenolpyruvate---glycerone phosphotransferase subunit DhaL
MPKTDLGIAEVEDAVRMMALLAIENETYFCDLDAELGDADFGTSLASGFKAILAKFDEIDRSDIGSFLIAVGMIISAKAGGTSGPIWGTGFLRAGRCSKGKMTLTLTDLADMGESSIQGIMERGGAEGGDKTLLDALIPAVGLLRDFSSCKQAGLQEALIAAADAAEAAIEGTRQLAAKRGRQSYATERSIGTLDPGIVAVAMMAKAIVTQVLAGPANI